MSDFERLLGALQQTGYHQWMKNESIPVVVGHGMEDVRDIQLAPWKRTGGSGAFVHLHGMEGITGMYVAEIPPGEALHPERHLYEELICIFAGDRSHGSLARGKEKKSLRMGTDESFFSSAQQLASTDQWRPGAGKIFSRHQRADGF